MYLPKICASRNDGNKYRLLLDGTMIDSFEKTIPLKCCTLDALDCYPKRRIKLSQLSYPR
jgi:hypothetical protein